MKKKKSLAWCPYLELAKPSSHDYVMCFELLLRAVILGTMWAVKAIVTCPYFIQQTYQVLEWARLRGCSHRPDGQDPALIELTWGMR